jgi:hypothetical protein
MKRVTEMKVRQNSLDFLSSSDNTTQCDALAKSLSPCSKIIPNTLGAYHLRNQSLQTLVKTSA